MNAVLADQTPARTAHLEHAPGCTTRTYFVYLCAVIAVRSADRDVSCSAVFIIAAGVAWLVARRTYAAGSPEWPVERTEYLRAAWAAGHSCSVIAIALGISRNTLEKHFAHELSVVALKKRVEVMVAMQVAAKKGNVAAQKAYLAFTPASAAPPARLIRRTRPKRRRRARRRPHKTPR